MKDEVLLLLEELISLQKKILLTSARRVVSQITEDDLLQPNDFPDLEVHPYFRYEEGTLHGMQVVQAALQRFFREKSVPER
jgi:hypothetical protein